MLVAPHARGRRVGQRLLQQALTNTTAAICTADVELENVASARCLLAAGFTEHIPPDDRDSRLFSWTPDGSVYKPSWG